MISPLHIYVLFLVPALATPTAGEPSAARELETLWGNLGTSDPVVVHQAISALVAKPADTVPFLRKRLRPVYPPEAARLARLIADLDSEEFQVRKSATQELERLGEPVESTLRKALANKPSAEMRRRIEQVLETHKRERLNPPPDQLRQARAVEVLEQIGNPAARRLLAELSKGAPRATLTLDAQGALDRLAR
jgi:hypothetical protein